jgi:hypothetical protein
MQLASFYKNSLVPSYERINFLSTVIMEVISSLQQLQPDPELVDDSKPFVRRQEIMNAIIKKVKDLPSEWKMTAKKRKAGGNFDFVIVHFEDLNLNLVPVHLLSYARLPKPSRYRGDISAFNYAVMKERGMISEVEFQTYLDFEQDVQMITEPQIPSNIEDIPFGLLLIYDGTDSKVPIRLAALTPDQEQYIFCDHVDLLKDYSQSKQTVVGKVIERKMKRRLKLNTTQVKDYQESPNIVVRKDNFEDRSDDNANTV